MKLVHHELLNSLTICLMTGLMYRFPQIPDWMKQVAYRLGYSASYSEVEVTALWLDYH